MKKICCILLICGMIFALTACGNKEEMVMEEEAVEESVEETTEESESIMLFGHFNAKTMDGEDVTEEIFANADLTMVNIWGTYCGPCIAEMPSLGEISREYKDKGVQMLGILCDVMEPGDDTAMEIIEETKADYIHLVASDDLTINVLQYVSSVPTTVFVDKEGYVVGEVYAGARDKTAWELIINQNLAKVQ